MTLRFHLTPVRIAIMKETNNKCWVVRIQEKETLIYYRWENKLLYPPWKLV
jgi:hypothetical protein